MCCASEDFGGGHRWTAGSAQSAESLRGEACTQFLSFFCEWLDCSRTRKWRSMALALCLCAVMHGHVHGLFFALYCMCIACFLSLSTISASSPARSRADATQHQHHHHHQHHTLRTRRFPTTTLPVWHLPVRLPACLPVCLPARNADVDLDLDLDLDLKVTRRLRAHGALPNVSAAAHRPRDAPICLAAVLACSLAYSRPPKLLERHGTARQPLRTMRRAGLARNSLTHKFRNLTRASQPSPHSTAN